VIIFSPSLLLTCKWCSEREVRTVICRGNYQDAIVCLNAIYFIEEVAFDPIEDQTVKILKDKHARR
jgi:hypothetical protein